MLIKELFLVSLAAIRANLLRSFLTILGIIIGVGAVITMVALGEGAQRQVEERIQRMGTDVLTIRPERARRGGVAQQGDSRLYISDAEALRDELAGELTIAPQNGSRMQISLLRWNTSEDVLGTWPEFAEIYSLGIEHETEVMSAHRTPNRVKEYAESARERGIEVFITGAGGSAGLPGVVASWTTLPVIGVPLPTSEIGGVDALYAIAQMPPGIPAKLDSTGRPNRTTSWRFEMLAVNGTGAGQVKAIRP